MKRFLSLTLCFVLALMLILASAVSAEVVEKADEQVMKDFLAAEPTTLDSGKANDSYALLVIMATQEPLIAIRTGEDGNISYTTDGGAESWEVSEDGLVYTFKLRDNKWSDDVAVKAEDYRYGILRNIDPATGCPYSYLLNPIKGAAAFNSGNGKMEDVGVEAPDDKTLIVTLEEPTPHFQPIFGNPVTYAHRKDFVEGFSGDTYGSEAENMIFNGSHSVSEWVHNNKITLVRNEHYWNNANVNYDQVNMPIINDTNTMMSMMDTGEISVVSTNLAEWRQKFSENENIKYFQRKNPQTFFMIFNCEDELFKNAKVRRAFSLALDREQFNDFIWDGNNVPATGWLPNEIYVGEINYLERAPKFFEKMKEESPDAKALLVEGLEELGMTETPEDLTISICLGSTDQWFKNFGEYLQEDLKETLGITLEIEQMDWPVFSDRVEKGDYQLGYMGWGSESPEPVALLSLHMSESNSLGTGWKNEEFDKLVKEAQHEVDEEKRLDLYIQAETILMEESPVAPVVFSVSNYYSYKNVMGLDYNFYHNMGYRFGYLAK